MRLAQIVETTPTRDRTFDVIGRYGRLLGVIRKHEHSGNYGFQPYGLPEGQGISPGTLTMILEKVQKLQAEQGR